jgi:hypothetical protein
MTSSLKSQSVYLVRFQVLTVASMKMSVFWDIAPCSLADVSEELAAAIIRVMSDLLSSEILVSIYQTYWCSIPSSKALLVYTWSLLCKVAILNFYTETGVILHKTNLLQLDQMLHYSAVSMLLWFSPLVSLQHIFPPPPTHTYVRQSIQSKQT